LVHDYGVYLNPTFVVIGKDSEVVWRQSGGLLDKTAAQKALEAA